MKTYGTHILADFSGADPKILDDASALADMLERAAEIIGAKILSRSFHRFDPQGVTGILLLSESHVSVHTWPEDGYAAFDLYTCGSGDAGAAADFVKAFLGAERENRRTIVRTHAEADVSGPPNHPPPWVAKTGTASMPPVRTTEDGRRWMFEADALPTSSVVLPVSEMLSQDAEAPQTVRVFETGDGRGRAMDIDGIVMLTDRDEAFFHEMLVHVPLGALPVRDEPRRPGRRVLVVGGGDGGTVREIAKYPDVSEIAVCDYDPRVAERARQFFPRTASALDDPRVRMRFEDAVGFVRGLPERSFDHVVIDGNGPFPDMEGALFSPDFYRQIFRILAPDGTASTFAGTPVSDPETYAAIVRTLRSVFPYAEPYLAYVPMYDTGCWGNLLLAKTPRRKDFSELPESPTPYRYVAEGVREAAFVLPAFARGGERNP